MTPEKLAKIFEAVKVIPLRPTDILVLRTTVRLTAKQADDAKEYFVEQTGHANVVVLDAAAELEVVRPESGFFGRLFGG